MIKAFRDLTEKQREKVRKEASKIWNSEKYTRKMIEALALLLIDKVKYQ